MIELERTFLAKYIPKGLENCKKKEIIDIYIPKSERHPILRIRKSGDIMEITKKCPVEGNDSTKQLEQTIPLSKEEYEELAKTPGKISRRIRHYYEHKGKLAEIDVFLDDLKGLVWVDFEFETEEEKDNFKMPDFCLADVSQEEFIAGGMICGNKYENIESNLKKWGYKKLS
ncbi:MAG: CYTH domain-containing protein, partial [Candidatus Woesearchaeota archaeon]